MHPFYLIVTITLCHHLLPPLGQTRKSEQPGKTLNMDAT
jgi:hypothetical protein